MKHIQAFAELVTGVKQMRKSVVMFPVFLIAVVALVLGALTLQGCNGDACIAIQEIVSCPPGLSNCDSFLTCPQGTVATGGGFRVISFSFGDIKIVASEPFSFGPDGEPIKWRVTAFTTNKAVVNQDFRATVICCGKKQ